VQLPSRKRLFISFSGGRTSAYMTRRLLAEQAYDETVVVFANSGEEDERTLQFVRDCDEKMGFNTVWVEAVVHATRRDGTTHKVVEFDTAARAGEPFEAMIKKFGIPNKNYPHCTRELKQRPLYSFIHSLGWGKGSYDVAVGIRADEADRISGSAEANNIVYPLVKWGVTKPDILAFWRQQNFDLYVPEHFGNCVFCWKKSFRKLLTVAKEDPSVFEFPAKMEAEFGFAGPGTKSAPRVFFRSAKSALDILAMANEPFEPFVDANLAFDPELDTGGGCGDSCEVFADHVWD
jgi:hypothetical protein